MAADCPKDIYKTLLSSWKEPTKLENRGFLDISYTELAKITEHTVPDDYQEIWDLFTGEEVPNLKKWIVKTKSGIKMPAAKGLIEQGEHVTPMYHPHASVQNFRAYNPMQFRFTWSKYGEDRPQFTTEEDAARAWAADVWAAEQAFREFKKLVIGALFLDLTAWSKLNVVGASGKEVGINMDIYNLYFKKVGESYPMYMQGLSVEKNFLPFKDGKPVKPVTSSDTSAKAYSVSKNHFEDTLSSMQKLIAVNEHDGEKTDLKLFTAQGAGSQDTQKLVGWIFSVKTLVKKAKKTRSTKYNLGLKFKSDGSCPTDGSTANICKAIKDKMKPWYESHQYSLGLVDDPSKCDENCADCGCCYVNEIYAKAEDLIVFINYDTLDKLENIKHIFNFPTADFTEGLTAFLGVKKVISIDEIPADYIYVIHKDAVKINYVQGSRVFGSQDYNEHDLTNMWIEEKFHITAWPFHCFRVKKPT